MDGRLLLLLVGLLAFVAEAKRQEATATGQLVCNGAASSYQTVDLYDYYTVGSSKKVATAQADGQGRFSIFGFVDQTLPFKSFVRIAHRCGLSDKEKKKKCHRQSDYDIGKDFVGKTKQMGSIDLWPEAQWRDKRVDC